MAITREQVKQRLITQEPASLHAILSAAKVSTRGAVTAVELAERVVDALWWNYSTPLGYLSDRASLDDIVDHVLRKIRYDERVPFQEDAWVRLQELITVLALDAGPVALDDLDNSVRAQIWPSWMPFAASTAGAGASLGARQAATWVLGWTAQAPRWLPYVPYLGSAFSAVHGTARAAAMVSGPLGLALGVVALNQSLGTNYHRLVPLLLGVGALGPGGIIEAEVVESVEITEV